MKKIAFGLAVCLALVSCGTGGDGDGACADWAGEWTFGSASCDGVTVSDYPLDSTIAANCTAETIVTESATCEITFQVTFLPEAGDTTVDPGAVTCSAGCTVDQCQATADQGQPYTSTISRSGNTVTSTTLVTAQMASDGVTPCPVGLTVTQVWVLVAK